MSVTIALKFILFLPLILGQFLYAAGYTIDGKIEGMEANKVYLQEFYGDESYLIDSTAADEEGHFCFQISAKKAPGQYRLIFSQRRFLDLIFNKENIGFSTSLAHPISEMEILASNENQIYYRYLKFRIKSQKRIDELKKQLYTYNESSDFYRELRQEYLSLIAQEDEFTEQLIHGNSNTLVADLIRIDREPNPEPAWDAKKTNQWVFDHYPDYFVFGDTTLLRTNAVSAKIIAYLSVALSLSHHPDSLEDALATAAFRLLASTGNDSTMFHFMQSYLYRGFNKLSYPNLATLIKDIPYPCCPCEIIEDLKNPSGTKRHKIPNSISLRNSEGKKVKIPLRKTKLHLLFNAPDCKWSDLMASQLEKNSKTGSSAEKLVIIYNEGETLTFGHTVSNIFYISDKNLSKILKTAGINQRPVLLTIDEEGKITEKITSWLELI